MVEKLLTIREVAHLLGISEKDVIECAERGEIPAYKVGGVYLRFQKDQVEHYKHKSKMAKANEPVGLGPSGEAGITAGERLRDFFYFYDFYILSAILIVILLVIITQG
jgi:excisionase family DNA binding protein